MVSSLPLFIAVLHIVLSAVSLTMTIMICLTIWMTKRVAKHLAYTLMFQENMAFLIHSVAHMLIGVNILFGNCYRTSQILGGVQNCSWIANLLFMLLLALERLNVTVLKSRYDVTGWKFVIISILVWLISLCFMGIVISPLTEYYFEVSTFGWNYAEDYKSTMVNRMETLFGFMVIPLTFAIYIIIYAFLVKQRVTSMDSANHRVSPEQKMLFVSTLTFLYLLLNLVLYDINDELEFNYLWYNGFVHTAFICLPLFCHAMLLSFNRTVRRDLLRRVLRRNINQVFSIRDPSKKVQTVRASFSTSISVTHQ
uniref:G_PROTEIN_RECEP_F1_2 domain-containing protein n=1 Tax=Steinernema glaseri TaxID=37863 RepID=A0A1I7ZYE9_9BILA